MTRLGRPQKVTTAQLLSALTAHEGSTVRAAAALGMTDRQVRRRVRDEGLVAVVAAMRPAPLPKSTLPPPWIRTRTLAAVDRHVSALREALSSLAGCPEQGDARGRVAALLTGPDVT